VDGDLSVNKLLFVGKERFAEKSCAHLISSGPWGMVHFWNVFHGSEIVARFPVVSLKMFILKENLNREKFSQPRPAKYSLLNLILYK